MLHKKVRCLFSTDVVWCIFRRTHLNRHRHLGKRIILSTGLASVGDKESDQLLGAVSVPIFVSKGRDWPSMWVPQLRSRGSGTARPFCLRPSPDWVWHHVAAEMSIRCISAHSAMLSGRHIPPRPTARHPAHVSACRGLI